MTAFQPSSHSDLHHSYGEGAGDSDEKKTPAEIIQQYLPIAQELLLEGDPRQEYEKKKGRLETLKAMYAGTSSEVLKKLYLSKIRSLEGEIKALKEQSREARTAVFTTQAGKIGLVVLVVSAGTAALRLGSFFRQKAKTEKWKRAQGSK